MEQGYEVLCLKDNIDEFVLKVLQQYDDKTFKNVSADKVDFQSAEEKEETEKLAQDNKDLLTAMKDALGDKITEVRLSTRLKKYPVCITTDGEITLEMEKVLNAMPTGEKVKAQRVLEVNREHPVFQALVRLCGTDDEKLKTYTHLLYEQALLIEGLPIEDPVEFAAKICSLME